MSKDHSADREAFWRGALRRRVESGITVAEFCSREGLKPTAYYYWQREIKRRDGLSQSGNGSGGKAALLPVQIVNDRGGSAAVEIVAKNGYVVRVSQQATTEHVRRVLEAVGELC